MKGKNKIEWIEKGYQMIADDGFTHVNVEALARTLNKNKSSFYYYFGDWSGFEDALLEYHLQLSVEFAASANNCQSIIPDMINLFLEHKTDIFFHKQLRINRDKPHFKACFEKVYTMFENAILEEWVLFLNLESHSFLASKFLTLISENFLLQITHQNYTFDWLKNYLIETANLMQNMNSKS